MTVPAQLSSEQVTAALRRWTGKDEHRYAAEELLIEHGFWLGRRDFLEHTLNYDADEDAAIIAWSQAREFLHTGPRGSTTELAVLDFATALGEDHYRITAMGSTHRRMIATAARTATAQ